MLFRSDDDSAASLQGAVPVGKVTRCCAQFLNLPFQCDEGDALDQIADRLAVTAAVHQDQTADGAGDTDNMFHSGQSGLLGFAGESGDPDPRLGFYPVSLDLKAGKVLSDAQDDAAHASVAEEEIAPLADDNAGEIVLICKAPKALDLGDVLRFDKEISRPADAPGAVIPQRGGKDAVTNIESGEFCQEGE